MSSRTETVIRTDTGHYYHFATVGGRVPTLQVTEGSVEFWIQEGAANGDGERTGPEEQLAGPARELPVDANEERIYALFIRRKSFRAKYDLRANGADFKTLIEKQEASSFPAEPIANDIGRFVHRSVF